MCEIAAEFFVDDVLELEANFPLVVLEGKQCLLKVQATVHEFDNVEMLDNEFFEPFTHVLNLGIHLLRRAVDS